MATPSDVSVGLAHELTITTTKAGWEPKDFAALAHSEDKAREILAYLRGFSEIKRVTHAIDCDATPFIPDGGRVLSEDQLPGRVTGIVTWDPTKTKLYLSKKQKGDKSLVGHDLSKELASQPVFTANVLDYLLKPENQHLTPEDWKGKAVFFWGTIYRDSCDYLYVRYLAWSGDRWLWNYVYWLDLNFHSSNPAVVRAS